MQIDNFTMIKHNVNTEKFIVYQLPGKDVRFVAIPVEFEEEIVRLTSEHANIKAIPSDRTVRGIFLDRTGNDLFLDENAQQSDITINRLKAECCAEFTHHKTL